MASFFTFRPSPTPIAGRVLVGVCMLGWGGISSLIIKSAFNPVHYTATQFTEVFIYEWLPVAKPIFLSLVPMIFLALMEIFQRISWKKLLFVAVTIGIILTIPEYLYCLKRWQPLVRTIQNLPLGEIAYHRHTGTLGAPAGMGIKFVTSRESVTAIKQMIESRIGGNQAELLKYRLEGDHPLTAEYLTREKPEGQVEFSLYVRPAFRGYDY